MRIKSKLLAIYIPILLIGMTLIGYWAYLTAYESVREREYKLLTQTLSLTFVELVEERHKLLVDSGLENVPMFREAYQKEVFDELDALHLFFPFSFSMTQSGFWRNDHGKRRNTFRVQRVFALELETDGKPNYRCVANVLIEHRTSYDYYHPICRGACKCTYGVGYPAPCYYPY